MVRFAHCDPKVGGLRFQSDGTGLSIADFAHDFSTRLRVQDVSTGKNGKSKTAILRHGFRR